MASAPIALPSPSAVAPARRDRSARIAACSVALASLGIAVMTGWWLRVPVVVRPYPALAAMQFNTALAFVVCAAALEAMRRDAYRVGAGFGLAILAFAGLTGLQYLVDVDVGLDRLFVDPFVTSTEWPKGRMAPRTALAFVCIGLSLLVASAARVRASALGLGALPVFALAGTGLVQLLFGTGRFSNWSGRLGGMAVHTTVGLGVAGVGLLLLAFRDDARRQRQPTWLPWAMALGVLTVAALLGQTLVVAFPAEVHRLVMATAGVLGATLAALTWLSTRSALMSKEHAARVERGTQALIESEAHNRALFEQSSAGVVEMDPSGRLLRVNQRFCEIAGRSSEDLRRLTLADITHPDDRAADQVRQAQSVAGTLPREGWMKRYVRPDGTAVWVNVSGALVHDSQGNPAFLIGVVQDASDLVASRRELESSQARLASFVEHTPAAVAMLDRDLRYVAVSRRWKEDYDLGDRDLTGRHHYDVFPEIRGLPGWQDVHQRCLQGAVERCEEDHFVRADGRDEWIQWEVRPWYDARGDIGGIVMLTEVITPRKLAAQALADSQQRLQLALDNARQGLWDWDVTSGRVVFDRRWAVIMGYELEELGETNLQTWERTVHPDDMPHISDALQRALASDESLYDVDYRGLRKDGSSVLINARGRVETRDADGRPLRMMGTIHDVTERKANDERLRSALREKEVLLREVHHRVKNNLAVISSLFYLQSSATRDQATIALLDDSRNRIQSMALVHELLYRSSNLAAIDLADYVSALASHLVRSQTTTARIDLVTSLEPVALAVDTAIPCGLILNEMLTNAMKHAFQGRPEGRLEIELRRAGADCVMQVSDDGIGIPEAVDPADAGTLGLRVMRSLTRQLDGTLEIVRGNPGTSARLTFRP